MRRSSELVDSAGDKDNDDQDQIEMEASGDLIEELNGEAPEEAVRGPETSTVQSKDESSSRSFEQVKEVREALN